MMRFSLRIYVVLSLLLSGCKNDEANSRFTFYEVPLVCGAAPEIGCGSRIKPLFIDAMNNEKIAEVWTNREGTVMAFKWSDKKLTSDDKNKTAAQLFMNHGIESKLITRQRTIDSLAAFPVAGSNWLKGMAVDSLSAYEAGAIAGTLTKFAADAQLINGEEARRIHADLASYFRKELVKVRTEKELTSSRIQDEWRENGFEIYRAHIGDERANNVRDYFDKHEVRIMKMESCCSEKEACCEKENTMMTEKSTITCPVCGYKQEETMPTDVCLIKYTCKKCRKELHPKEDDCCVFCSYGDHECPSKQ
jgi:hypothetical protein